MRGLLLAAALLLPAPPSAAAVPQRLNYQGKLANAAGDPLSGTYSFRFKLFSAETGGAALFSEDVTGANAQSVVNGIYSVQIGSYTAGGIPYGVFEGADLYLEIDVNPGSTLTGAETLSPRERLNAAAWAVHALGAERLGAGAVIATFTASGALQLPSGSTITASGTLTLSTAASAALSGRPAIFLDSDGEVGLGTNAPIYRLDVVGDEAGVDGHTFAVRNTNNAAGAAASFKLVTAGASAGNPFAHFTVTGVTDWTMGIQNNDADKFKITPYYVLGEAPGLTVDTSGRVGVSTGSPQGTLDVAGSAHFGPLANKSTFTAMPGGTTFSLQTASGVFVASGPLYLNGAGAHLRFPDGTTMATAGAGGAFVARAGDTMTGQLTLSGSSLTVINGSAAQSFVLAATTASDRSVYGLYVATTGHVGIGTGSPGSTSFNDFLEIKTLAGKNHVLLSGNPAGGAAVRRGADTGFLELWGGSNWNTGGTLYLNGNAVGADPGFVQLQLGRNDAAYEFYDADASNRLAVLQGGGRLGLGTNVPAARLHVSSAGAVAADKVLAVSSGAAASQELLTVRGNGKVSVGTAVNGDARLDVSGPGYFGDQSAFPGGVFIGAGGWPYSIGAQWNTDADDGALRLNPVGYQAGVTRFRDLIVYDGKQNTLAYFDGSNRDATALPTAGSDAALEVAGPVMVSADGFPGGLFLGGGGWPYSIGSGWNSNTDDHALRFNAVGYQAGITRFRDLIVYDGKTNPIAFFDGSTAQMGIGTLSPAARLDVNGSAQFGSGATKSTFTAAPGGAAYALETSSGINVGGTGGVVASFFAGNGAALTGVTASDASKVAKAGDTMTGQLTVTGSSVTILNTNVGGTGDAFSFAVTTAPDRGVYHLYVATTGQVNVGGGAFTVGGASFVVVGGGASVGATNPAFIGAGLALQGRTFQVFNGAANAQVSIRAAGNGAIWSESGSGFAGRRLFFQQHYGAGNQVIWRNASEATGATNQDNILVLTSTGGVGVGVQPRARLHVSSAGAVAADNVLLVSSGAAAGQELLSVKGNGDVNFGNNFSLGSYPGAAIVRLGDLDMNNKNVLLANKVSISDTGSGEGFCFDNADCTPGISVFTAAQGGYNAFVFDTDAGFPYVFNNGNVGIGTTTPNAKLYVQADGFDNLIGLGGSITDNIGYMTFMSNSSPARRLMIGGIDGVAIGTGPHTAFAEVVRVSSTGNVGIGTTVPQFNLDFVNDASIGSLDRIIGFNDLRFYVDDAGAAQEMFLGPNGLSIGYLDTDPPAGTALLVNGGVGIGLTAPTARLHVASGTTSTTDNLLLVSTGTTNLFRVQANGNVFAHGAVTGGGADLAEMYAAQPEVEPGDVVELAPSGRLRRADESSRRVMGIISSNPGSLLGWDSRLQEMPDHRPLALAGRVPVKFSDENGPARRGDALTPASVPGFARRARAGELVIGSVLEDAGPGKVLAYVRAPDPHGRAELLELREQNERLRRDLEELRRAVQSGRGGAR